MRHAVVELYGRGTGPFAVRCLVPETLIERSRGLEALNGRGLMDDEGMLFFHTASIHMAGVRFSIDIVFVRGNAVVAIAEDVQPGSTIRWAADNDYVLEVRGGWCRERAVVPGSYASSIGAG